MNMMHVSDALHLSNSADRGLQVEVLRRALQQDVQRLAQDTPGGPEQDEPECHAEQRIDGEETREADHQRRDDDEGATDDGLDDVPEGAPDRKSTRLNSNH